MILAWANAKGGVSVTAILVLDKAAAAIAALTADGYLLPDAEVLVDPVLPDGPRHQWRLRNGKIIVDTTVPEPERPLDALKAATTVAAMKAALVKLFEST